MIKKSNNLPCLLENKKSGMAIPLVLLFATVLGLLATYTIKNAQNYNESNRTSYGQLQVYFLARAGVEHALLKTRYMQRELYDAICLSQGRNPLFDYTSIRTETGVVSQSNLENAVSRYNPGPIFLYEINEFTSDGLLTTGFNKANRDLWLDAFKSDICSETESAGGENSILSFARSNSFNEPILGRMADPFTEASYKIDSLEIAASTVSTVDASDKIENSAVVELNMLAEARIAKGNVWNHAIKKTVRINRQ